MSVWIAVILGGVTLLVGGYFLGFLDGRSSRMGKW